MIWSPSAPKEFGKAVRVGRLPTFENRKGNVS